MVILFEIEIELYFVLGQNLRIKKEKLLGIIQLFTTYFFLIIPTFDYP